MKLELDSGRSLKKIRVSRKMERRIVAEKSGVSEHLITAIEDENRKAFTSILVYKMTARKLEAFYKEESVKQLRKLDSIPLFLRV
jgi:DNA-binding XRE family transcriptional regulator